MSNKVTGVRPLPPACVPLRTVELTHRTPALQKPMMEIVFREHANARAGPKFRSLCPGLGYAAGYKGASLPLRASLGPVLMYIPPRSQSSSAHLLPLLLDSSARKLTSRSSPTCSQACLQGAHLSPDNARRVGGC